MPRHIRARSDRKQAENARRAWRSNFAASVPNFGRSGVRVGRRQPTLFTSSKRPSSGTSGSSNADSGDARKRVGTGRESSKRRDESAPVVSST